MRFFSSIVTKCKDVAGKLRQISASSNDIDVENRQLMQHYGLISVPKKGSRVLFLSLGGVTLGIASDSDDRPALEEGEVALYATKDHFIHLKKDGSIVIKASAGMQIDGDLKVNGQLSDSIGSLSSLRSKYNNHTHVSNGPGAPTNVPIPIDAGDI